MNAGRAKVESEGACRCCGAPAYQCDAAHTWDRSLSCSGFDEPDLIVPLCSAIRGSASDCHGQYDRHQLDLLPHMTPREQAAMVLAAGSIERARKRAKGSAS